MRELLQLAQAAAREAGAATLPWYREGIAVTEKADRSPLTDADRAAHAVLLRRLAPTGLPVLSEESPEAAFAARREWRRLWLVDPLDGTKEFLARNGEFTINVALIEDGRAVLGVVYAPVTGELYWGGADGAYRQAGDSPPQALQVRSLPDHPTVVVSRSHRGPEEELFLRRLPPHDTLTRGSALKFCLIAEGRADLYPRFGPTMEWDTAAGQAVLEAAGGGIVDRDGRPFTYNRRATLRNGRFVAFGDRAALQWW